MGRGDKERREMEVKEEEKKRNGGREKGDGGREKRDGGIGVSN